MSIFHILPHWASHPDPQHLGKGQDAARWPVLMSLLPATDSKTGIEAGKEIPKDYREPVRIAIASRQHGEVSINVNSTKAREVPAISQMPGLHKASKKYVKLRLAHASDAFTSTGSIDSSSECSDDEGYESSGRPGREDTALTDSCESDMGCFDSPYLQNGMMLGTDEALDKTNKPRMDIVSTTFQAGGWSFASVAGQEKDTSYHFRPKLHLSPSTAVVQGGSASLAAEAQVEYDDGMEADASLLDDDEMDSDLELARQMGATGI
jgi:hypothetical protein